MIKLPSSGLASQTSRCTKKSQRTLSPLKGQSTGRWGLSRLRKTGGSDEARVSSLRPMSALFCFLLLPSLEETECWKFFLIVCVEDGGCQGCRVAEEGRFGGTQG